MNKSEKKLLIKFILIFAAASILIAVMVTSIFYDKLIKLRNLVKVEYTQVYMENKNRELKDAVSHILLGIKYDRLKLYSTIKNKLEKRAAEGCKIADFLYKNSDFESTENVKHKVLKMLKIINKNYFVFNDNGTVEMSPIFPKGFIMADYHDAYGNNVFNIIRDDIKKSGQESSFMEYYIKASDCMNNACGQKTRKIIVCVRYFKPLGWYIGSISFFDNFEKRLKQEFKERIAAIRYGTHDEGYFFVNRIVVENGKITVTRLVNPNKPKSAIGKTIPLTLKDADGKLFNKEMVYKSLKYGGGYVSYQFRIPKSNKVKKKISYVAYDRQWHWMIGTGYYVYIFNKDLMARNDVLNKFIKKNMALFILEVILFLFVLFVFVFVFVKKIITDISLYREKSREGEKFRIHLIESMPNPLIIFDGEGKVIGINRSFEEFFGVNQNDVDTAEDIQIDILKDIALSYLQEESENTKEIDMVDTKGRLRNMQVHITAYKQLGGTPKGVIIVLFDITKQKIVEKELIDISIKDELTKLYNRRYFNQVLQNVIDKSKRFNETFSVIMYDIDHFKQINDTYGHQAGDRVLRELSRLVLNSIRKIDDVFRIGGEEFIILLFKTDFENAMRVAEKIRKTVEFHYFEGIGTVTISMGVVEFKDEDSVDSILRRVDGALYKAKKSGRNRVVGEK